MVASAIGKEDKGNSGMLQIRKCFGRTRKSLRSPQEHAIDAVQLVSLILTCSSCILTYSNAKAKFVTVLTCPGEVWRQRCWHRKDIANGILEQNLDNFAV